MDLYIVYLKQANNVQFFLFAGQSSIYDIANSLAYGESFHITFKIAKLYHSVNKIRDDLKKNCHDKDSYNPLKSTRNLTLAG